MKTESVSINRIIFTSATIITAIFVIIYIRIMNSNFQELKMIEKVSKPNFVLLLTDDQDSWMGSLKYMKNVNNLLKNNGLNYENSFVASPLCCPSRSSILTGQYVHNHKAINNSISGGCNSNFWQNGPEKQTFVNKLHENGYNNFFAGKYLNQYGTNEGGGVKHIPPGWDWWIGLEGNSKYYDYNLSVNGSREKHGKDENNDYLSNVIKRYAIEYIEQLPNSLDHPFFMMISTPACHAPFTPELKYKTNFTEKNIPRTPNFNVANDKLKNWLLRYGDQPLSHETVKKLDQIYRDRLRTLLTVDDIVADVHYALQNKNLLDNTYIIFTSDNGYHLGQFSLPYDKREPYEFDIRVPFIIKGPNVRNGNIQTPITNIDIAPTILDLAGINIPISIDGTSKKEEILISNPSRDNIPRTVLIEHSGESKNLNIGCSSTSGLYGCSPNFQCKCTDSINNTYECVRCSGGVENYLYCSWSSHFEEFYNLNADNNQLDNIIDRLDPKILKDLRNYLKQYKICKSQECRLYEESFRLLT